MILDLFITLGCIYIVVVIILAIYCLVDKRMNIAIKEYEAEKRMQKKQRGSIETYNNKCEKVGAANYRVNKIA